MRGPDTELPEPTTVNASGLYFPNLVKPNDGDKFSVAVRHDELPHSLSEIMAEEVMKAKASKWGLVTFRSNLPPRIYGLPTADLITFRQTCDAMNIPFDFAIARHPAQIMVSFWENRDDQIKVALEAVQINTANIDLPKFGELPSWRTK